MSSIRETCVYQLRNQGHIYLNLYVYIYIYAFDNHNEFKGCPILNPVFDDVLSYICYCNMSLKT